MKTIAWACGAVHASYAFECISVQDGYAYATNGTLMARCPCDAPEGRYTQKGEPTPVSRPFPRPFPPIQQALALTPKSPTVKPFRPERLLRVLVPGAMLYPDGAVYCKGNLVMIQNSKEGGIETSLTDAPFYDNTSCYTARLLLMVCLALEGVQDAEVLLPERPEQMHVFRGGGLEVFFMPRVLDLPWSYGPPLEWGKDRPELASTQTAAIEAGCPSRRKARKDCAPSVFAWLDAHEMFPLREQDDDRWHYKGRLEGMVAQRFLEEMARLRRGELLASPKRFLTFGDADWTAKILGRWRTLLEIERMCK